MTTVKVGTRKLKSKLGEYIRRVKDGETIIVTERGKTIGQIFPVKPSIEGKLQAVVDAGLAEWIGKKGAARQTCQDESQREASFRPGCFGQGVSIICLDTCPLLKEYILEAYSDDVGTFITSAAGAGTSILTYTAHRNSRRTGTRREYAHHLRQICQIGLGYLPEGLARFFSAINIGASD